MKNYKTSAVKVNYIVILSSFVILFAINFLMLYMVSLPASGTALIINLIITAIPTFIVSLFSCMTFAKKGNADTKTFSYCFQRMYITILLLFLGSLAVSAVGGIVINAFIGGTRTRIDNLFVRGAVLKIPMLAIYLVFVYKLFVRHGYLDSEHKCFNPEFKTITFMYSFILMLPNMIYDSMYYTYSDAMMINVHTALSPNIDFYTEEAMLNSNFSIILVILSIVAVLLIELAAAMFAYNRGKKLFFKEHPHSHDYATDENGLAVEK